jgi:hypothetical protein
MDAGLRTLDDAESQHLSLTARYNLFTSSHLLKGVAACHCIHRTGSK